VASYQALLEPLTIKNLTLRNRVMSTSHAPAYGDDGMPGERYQLYHEEKAKGGIGLTMFGGSASVAIDSPATPWRQLALWDDAIIPYFQAFAERVQRHGAALMCQITHMGRRTRWDTENWLAPVSSSGVREPAHRSFPKAMEDHDIRRITEAYGAAARRCREGGLDGCEVLVANHLIMQFLSPRTNRRSDAYGGPLENRLRFALEVLEAVRRAVGEDFVVGIRMTADEFAEGGLDHEDCMAVIRRLATSGLVDFLNVSGGEVFSHMELTNYIPNMAYPVAPYLYLASAVRQISELPVFHAARIPDIETAARAVAEGHVDMVGMTRPHMADPHIVAKLAEGRVDDIRQCVGAGYCLDRIYLGEEALCIQNPATGREATMPHAIAKAERSRRVVVVGAGPAGLEAARAAAARGHVVVLFEKESESGGQINLAARATWRQSLSGISRWLDGQVRKLGVEMRLGAKASLDDVLACEPEVVVIATGGRPNTDVAKGAELAVSSWEILSGAVAPAETVLLFDDQGGHQGASCAEFMARAGARVEIVSPDRAIADELGNTNFATHLRELYRAGVVLTPDTRLVEIGHEGNRLVAVLRNEYDQGEEERAVDQVVIEHGTVPDDDLYFALKPHSRNLGEVDLEALVAGRPQAIESNPDGRFQLFRVGDAVASRNIHAAIYDSLRLCKDL
jgi:2,4-dienoyl-CoA reductase-like NADH-dependent reductase (Old Yellow Enzyme family)/glycine/D-amino acid oxidase-like deaminating enzyme